MDINATLLGQMLTFMVLVGVTMKYVWPPIVKAMREREKTIAAGLEAATRSQRELEQAEHKALEIIRAAKLESSQIIDSAHKRSAQLIEEAKENAKLENSRILAHAQDEITREVNQAKEALRKQLARLAVAGAEKIIQRNIDSTVQSGLLDELVAEI